MIERSRATLSNCPTLLIGEPLTPTLEE